jgi:hypothetical protein
MKKPLFSLLFVLCCLTALVHPSSCAQAQESHAGSRLVTFFWGIISHTRWPNEDEKAVDANGADVDRPLRVCLPENNRRAALIRDSAQSIPIRLRRQVVIHALLPDAACDVVYFPAMPGDGADIVLRSFIGQPVLTIGEGNAFCSVGGMFCLLSDDGSGTINKFAANLDVISRSSLQINPQVLRLSKHLQEH